MGIFDPFYTILDAVFQPFFSLIPYDERISFMVGIFIVSIFIAFITTFATARVIDQDEMKKNKKKLSAIKEKFEAATKAKDDKKAKKFQSEMMSVQGETMKNSIKPMMYTFPPIILVFQWLRQYGPLQTFIFENDFLVSLPFTLPKYGNQFGWLGWYIVCSFMTSTVLRKIFKIQT
jgi:uncharacterized membrane protein (DUF106 family)